MDGIIQIWAVRDTMQRVRRIVDGHRFLKLDDVNSDAVQTSLRLLRQSDGLG